MGWSGSIREENKIQASDHSLKEWSGAFLCAGQVRQIKAIDILEIVERKSPRDN